MTHLERQEQVRLGRLETVGAWLRIWTPPKGAVVPPFPRKRAAVGVLVLTAGAGAIGVFAVPRIDESKRRGGESELRALAERRALERRRLMAHQAAVRGAVPRPAGGLTPIEELRARRGLLRAVERAVTAEARRRVAVGTLTGRIVRTECTPSPRSSTPGGAERDLRFRRVAYDCLAVTRDIPATSTSSPGRLGHPFRAVVDFRRLTFAFCKTNPPPGERAVPDPRATPRLPRACTGP